MSMSIRKGEKGGRNNHPVSIKCICNNKEYFIPIGEGNQTLRWLGLVLAHRVKNDKKTHGRLQQRQRMKSNDGRDVVVPLPLLVQCGKHKDFCDPKKKIKDLLSIHGHNLEFHVELGFDIKPEEDGGVIKREDFCNFPKGLKQFRRGNTYHVGDRVLADSSSNKVSKNKEKRYETIYVAKKFEFLATKIPALDNENWMQMPKGPSWSDAAFNGEAGRKRYQQYVIAEKKAKKMEDKVRAEENNFDDDDDQNGESNAILVKIIHDMSQVLLDDVLLGDSEAIRNAKKKIEHFVRQNYPFICSIFEHFTFNSLCTDREGTILINGCGAIRYIDLVHFVVQNHLMKPTEETFETIEQIMKNMGSSRLSEIAREEGDSGGKRSDEGKKSDVEGPGINYFFDNGLTQGKFIEWFIRLSFNIYRNEQNLKGHGSKKKISNTNATLSQQVNYVRKVLQDVQPYFDRRNNLRMRRLVASEETKNLIESNFEQLKQVFDFYGTADANKDNSISMNRNSINFREFLLLTTDSMLLGECPGDTNEETQNQALIALIGSQTKDESSSINALQQSEAKRLSSGIFMEITFSEFIEAVVRIALTKWDDPTIPNMDKIQLAFEAISILAQ
jgi:hypothetical protein